MSETDAKTRVNSLYSLTAEQRRRAVKCLEEGISQWSSSPSLRGAGGALKRVLDDSLQYAQDSEEMRASLLRFETEEEESTKKTLDCLIQEYKRQPVEISTEFKCTPFLSRDLLERLEQGGLDGPSKTATIIVSLLVGVTVASQLRGW